MADTMALASVDVLLEVLWQAEGTDLLLTAGAPPLVRVDGELLPVADQPELRPADPRELVHALLSERQQERLAAGADVDFSFSWGGRARVRGNAFRQQDSVAVALRVIPRYIPTFDQLGLPPGVRRFSTLNQGLVLVTGPTGSGKSTTLASLIDWMNNHRALHILTIEDPIEFVHYHRRSAVNQRQVGTDTDSFADALRSALREDPDVLLVGEIRDLESIRFALTLAETGHLLFATLHTNDTAQAIDRLIDVFPPEQQQQIRVQLASTLTGVVYQRLLPRVGGGRVAAFEVLIATPPVRNLVKEGKTNQIRNMIVTGQRDGMQTLEASLGQLVLAGAVSYEEAASRSLYPREIRQG
jgi:twitching motility protein PilT